MNSSDVYGLYAGVLLLGAGALAAIWNGVIVITFSLGVKVVPPWSRHEPAPRKKPAAKSTPGAAVDEAAAPGGPTVLRSEEAAAA